MLESGIGNGASRMVKRRSGGESSSIGKISERVAIKLARIEAIFDRSCSSVTLSYRSEAIP